MFVLYSPNPDNDRVALTPGGFDRPSCPEERERERASKLQEREREIESENLSMVRYLSTSPGRVSRAMVIVKQSLVAANTK